ncbi:MAG: flagellar brake protein [Ignavibacteria bacterium]
MKDEGAVTSAIEVAYLLQQLIRTKELLNVSFNHGRDSMTTLLLHADRDRDHIVFDGSSDPAINRNIVAAARLTFAGMLHGAKLEFSAVAARELAYRGAPALSVRFPASIKRFQNRESFRVQTRSTTCTVPVPGRGYVSVPVPEISVGGVLLLIDSAEDVFRLGQTIDCSIELGSLGRIRCDLEVRGFKRMPSRRMGMGCRFARLSRSDEALIARFVSQQERETLAKKGFFGL